MIVIGIQGGKGSFSEEAAHIFAERQQIKQFDIDYLISSENVLEKVESGSIDYGIFAMENAQGGLVMESTYALATHRCTVIDTFQIMVVQNLLTLPNTKSDNITAIHSHRQALRQCRRYLADNFWGVDLVEADDTAESARKLSEGELPATAAVIANKACAEHYNLELLQESIHDLKNNLTLFLGVTKFKEA